MTGLATVVENIPEDDKRWWNKNQVQAFIDSLAPHQAERLQRFLNAKEKLFALLTVSRDQALCAGKSVKKKLPDV